MGRPITECKNKTLIIFFTVDFTALKKNLAIPTLSWKFLFVGLNKVPLSNKKLEVQIVCVLKKLCYNKCQTFKVS